MSQKSTFLLVVISLLLFSACKHTNDNNNISDNDPSVINNEKLDPEEVYTIANDIIQKGKNDLIWNLTDIDSIPQLDTTDFFTNSKTKNRLVLMSGHAGLSSGTADNLLILFENNTSNVLFACQIGNIAPEDFKDLTNDGIKEIISKSYTIYMGECNDNVLIFNLKNNKQNILYNTFSKSVIECGLENINSAYKEGDTLEGKFEYIIKTSIKNSHFIEQLKTIKIHNGGKNNEEIINNANVSYENKTIYLE